MPPPTAGLHPKKIIATGSIEVTDNQQNRILALEVVSKFQIRFKDKASSRSRKRSIHRYVSIYRRLATQALGLRWDFETTSKKGQTGIEEFSRMVYYSNFCWRA
jgi:hypothetical protein